MTITREQVADLQPGDVVELSFPSGSAIRGTLTHEEYSSSGLGITDAHWTVRFGSGEVPPFITGCTLTVVSRAPRPLYVNHPRTEPVDGDIARDRDGDAWRRQAGMWLMAGGSGRVEDNSEYAPLTLLWDGQTKQVVQ